MGHISERQEQDWKELIQQARQAVFRRLALLGITQSGSPHKIRNLLFATYLA